MANQQLGSYFVNQIESRSVDLGGRIRSSAQTLRSVAQQLRADGMTAFAGELVDSGAGVAERIGTYLEESDLDMMVSDAEDFTRRRPVTVAMLGVATGLLASRLVKSTAARRFASAQTDSEPADAEDRDAASSARSGRRRRGKKKHHTHASRSQS